MLIAFLAATAAAPPCTIPALSMDSGDAAFSKSFAVGSLKLAQVKDNFAKAYANACAKGLLKSDLPGIVLLNAPNANIASTYSDDARRRVLEYPFVTEDGQTHVPAVEELEEAVYCAIHGASAKEQQESGRCLPD
jgi:hypothetical protein